MVFRSENTAWVFLGSLEFRLPCRSAALQSALFSPANAQPATQAWVLFRRDLLATGKLDEASSATHAVISARNVGENRKPGRPRFSRATRRRPSSLAILLHWTADRSTANELRQDGVPRGVTFVRRQPETSSELDALLRVVETQELGCVRYRGSDPMILRRAGEAAHCDVQPSCPYSS
jgi:hypothetical protein